MTYSISVGFGALTEERCNASLKESRGESLEILKVSLKPETKS